MMGFDRLKRRWIRFKLEEAGTAVVEMVLMTPILVWGFVITLQFFDAYRAELVSTKAALTVADLYSRETGYINTDYLNGTASLLKFLNLTKSEPDFRVSVVSWDSTNLKYIVKWSKERGTSRLPHDDLSINQIASQLPLLSSGENMILIETWTPYKAKYGDGIGLMMGTGLQGNIEFTTLVPMRPRFAPTLCFLEGTDVTQALC